MAGDCPGPASLACLHQLGCHDGKMGRVLFPGVVIYQYFY